MTRDVPPQVPSRIQSAERTAPRYVLGFDTACATCSAVARRVRRASNGLLETRGLLEPDMRRWRRRDDGTDGPWRPTLAIVNGTAARTVTGWRMPLVLARHLGPVRSMRVARAVGAALRKPSR